MTTHKSHLLGVYYNRCNKIYQLKSIFGIQWFTYVVKKQTTTKIKIKTGYFKTNPSTSHLGHNYIIRVYFAITTTILHGLHYPLLNFRSILYILPFPRFLCLIFFSPSIPHHVPAWDTTLSSLLDLEATYMDWRNESAGFCAPSLTGFTLNPKYKLTSRR